jgi:hypothetical protein
VLLSINQTDAFEEFDVLGDEFIPGGWQGCATGAVQERASARRHLPSVAPALDNNLTSDRGMRSLVHINRSSPRPQQQGSNMADRFPSLEEFDSGGRLHFTRPNTCSV